MKKAVVIERGDMSVRLWVRSREISLPYVVSQEYGYYEMRERELWHSATVALNVVIANGILSSEQDTTSVEFKTFNEYEAFLHGFRLAKTRVSLARDTIQQSVKDAKEHEARVQYFLDSFLQYSVVEGGSREKSYVIAEERICALSAIEDEIDGNIRYYGELCGQP